MRAAKETTKSTLVRTPIFWAAILGGLGIGGFIVLCGLILWDGRQEAISQADQAATNVAEGIEQDISRTIELYDLSLQGVIEALNEPEIAQLKGKAHQMALFDRAATATFLNSIVVTNAAGDVIEDSISQPPRHGNLADRDFFLVQKDNPDVGMYLSPPFKSRLSAGVWVVALSRRITNPDGSFGGVVAGTVQLDYFEILFENLHLGAKASFALFRSDGRLIARKPFQLSAIGADLSKAPLFDYYPIVRSGYFETAPLLDGIPRRFTFRQIKNLPLVVTVGYSVADIYASWRQKALVTSLLMACLSLAIIGLATLLWRELNRRRLSDGLLRESESRYRLLSDNSSDGIVLRSVDGKRIYASPAFYQMLGRSEQEIGDNKFTTFLHDDSRNAPSRTVARLQAGEQGVIELLQYRRPDGEWIWLEAVSTAILDDKGAVHEIVANVRDVTRRKIAEDELAAAAATDGLTGLANRRCFDERGELEWKRATRSEAPLALLMIDVDNFKNYNDTFGHVQGDNALKTIAACIKANIRRPTDLGARYGGEEFVVLLPDTDAPGAFTVAEKIRRAVAECALVHPISASRVVTISVGVICTRPERREDFIDLVKDADAALYRAKEYGRNRVEQAASEPVKKVSFG